MSLLPLTIQLPSWLNLPPAPSFDLGGFRVTIPWVIPLFS